MEDVLIGLAFGAGASLLYHFVSGYIRGFRQRLRKQEGRD